MIIHLIVGFSRLNDATKKEVVKETVCDALIGNANDVQTSDTSNLVKKSD